MKENDKKNFNESSEENSNYHKYKQERSKFNQNKLNGSAFNNNNNQEKGYIDNRQNRGNYNHNRNQYQNYNKNYHRNYNNENEALQIENKFEKVNLKYNKDFRIHNQNNFRNNQYNMRNNINSGDKESYHKKISMSVTTNHFNKLNESRNTGIIKSDFSDSLKKLVDNRESSIELMKEIFLQNENEFKNEDLILKVENAKERLMKIKEKMKTESNVMNEVKMKIFNDVNDINKVYENMEMIKPKYNNNKSLLERMMDSSDYSTEIDDLDCIDILLPTGKRNKFYRSIFDRKSDTSESVSGMFIRKSSKLDKKQTCMDLFENKERTEILSCLMNETLNKLTPESIIVIGTELISQLQENIQNKEELDFITLQIIRHGTAAIKFAPQIAKLCSFMYGRVSVEEDTFEHSFLICIYTKFMEIISIDQELNGFKVKGIFNFFAYLYLESFITEEMLTDVIKSSIETKVKKNLTLIIEYVIEMIIVIVQNDRSFAEKFRSQCDEVTKASLEYIKELEGDIGEKMKFKLMDFEIELNKKEIQAINKNEELVDNFEKKSKELKTIFLNWFHEDTEDVSKVVIQDNQLTGFDIFYLIQHVLDEGDKEQKRAELFCSNLKHIKKVEFETLIIVLMALKEEMEMDYPKYIDIISQILKPLHKNLNFKINLKDHKLINQVLGELKKEGWVLSVSISDVEKCSEKFLKKMK